VIARPAQVDSSAVAGTAELVYDCDPDVGCLMFAEARQQRGWSWPHLMSFAAHCALVVFLVRGPAPKFIQPTSVMAGFGGTSVAMIYLPSDVKLGEHPAAAPHNALVAPVRSRKPPKIEPARQPPKAEGEPNKGDDVRATLAGSPYGSLGSGPTYGHEIRPALPSIFPDPLPPSLPPGVRGDVVVQVTIDAQGNITDKKILKALGYGAEERVLAALEGWRFRPATEDGVPIPSQQYMYFHFPS
jgi:TonB family protein